MNPTDRLFREIKSSSFCLLIVGLIIGFTSSLLDYYSYPKFMGYQVNTPNLLQWIAPGVFGFLYLFWRKKALIVPYGLLGFVQIPFVSFGTSGDWMFDVDRKTAQIFSNKMYAASTLMEMAIIIFSCSAAMMMVVWIRDRSLA